MNKEVINILKNGLKEAINEDCTLKLKIEGCKILLDYINQLETNIDEAIRVLKETGCYDEEIKTFCDDVWDELPYILEILERGKE
jgi:hypothetical protein